MSMNPVETTNRISTDYVDYLKSILSVKNPEIKEKIFKTLEKSVFVKGPYLEATLPYVTGRSLSHLIDEGIASDEFTSMGDALEIDRPLYVHQENAFLKVTKEKRNIVVATGTGSGKTECFMYPIFQALMNEKINHTLSPGVRALFLYPMNALANDQMKRLRELLKEYPHITFGRYTGETIDGEDKALEVYKAQREAEIKSKNRFARKNVDYTEKDLSPLPNELISREAMRKSPPHILLTNYAMLEFLLIRPDDHVFFSSPLGDFWKFIVLDEAHTYKGANGTEIALLLRRLKERIGKHAGGQIQCIATSATLGDMEALDDLALFATDIFGEAFETQDMITSQRIKQQWHEKLVKHSIKDYEAMGLREKEMEASAYGTWLHQELCNDERIVGILQILENKPKSMQEVATYVFADVNGKEEQQKGLIQLIQLGVKAKESKESMALLPARYHLFVKSLEGVYVSLYPEKQLFLDRRESVVINKQISVPAYELANCQHCGQEYLVGMDDGGRLMPLKAEETPNYYLLSEKSLDQIDVSTDSDEETLEVSKVDKVEPYSLCTACGDLTPFNRSIEGACCDVNDKGKRIKLYKITTAKKTPNTCVSCGSVSQGIIKRFLTANQPATYTITNSLYTMIPPQKMPERDTVVKKKSLFVSKADNSAQVIQLDAEKGRKLLVFSDSRQEAAFFAAYMGNKYNQLMWRRLILNILRDAESAHYLEDVASKMVLKAEQYGLYPAEENLTHNQKSEMAWKYLLKEFLAFEKKQGLEGNAYVRFLPEPIEMQEGLWGLSPEETWDTLAQMLDTLRVAGTVSYPEAVNPDDDYFAPRNRQMYFRKKNAEKERANIISFLPVGNRNNKRSDFMKKLSPSLDVGSSDTDELLSTLFEAIEALTDFGYIQTVASAALGVVYLLNLKKWQAIYVEEEDSVYQCLKCKKRSNYNIRNVCTEFRCDGKLEEIPAGQYREDPYYSKLYNESKLIPMIAEEHTAQLNRDEAGKIQKRFEEGEVNVLSCSTTFEMGVDVGQLEAIFLRNVPPETANYVQRAGRAGRRTAATAFSVTFARRNSHDMNYFIDPTEMISGKIRSPYIELKNDKIASRHVNSMVMAWFFKKDREFFDGRLTRMMGIDYDDDIQIALKNELEQQPPELLQTIQCVLPDYLKEKLKIEEWKFVQILLGESGSLTNAISQAVGEREALLDIIEKRKENKKSDLVRTDDILRHINTLDNKSTINFLASSGIIPKYGFPVDVVKLDIFDHSPRAQSVDLSRDLKMAIAEYAPGSEVIAAGKMWTSHALNRIRDKEWPTYPYYECPDCKVIEIGDEPTTLEKEQEIKEKLCKCDSQAVMKPHKFVIPIFGFSTKRDAKSKSVGDSRPARAYPTKIQFAGLDKVDEQQEKERIFNITKVGHRLVKSMYSPEGKLVILNKGMLKKGIFLCQRCGYAQSTPEQFQEHQNKYGYKCGNKHYSHVALGHIFHSDVLRLDFPQYQVKAHGDCSLWKSLLYAVLEGASEALGISRNDINGCIEVTGIDPTLILFDEAAGGAGHVKQIINKFEYVLKAAYKRTSGKCGCGPETSCYGCLRSYSNQMDHDDLSRGMANEYLEWILFNRGEGENIQSERVLQDEYEAIEVLRHQASQEEEGEKTFLPSDEWKDVLELLTAPSEKHLSNLAVSLINAGLNEAPMLGYELMTDEQGVLGSMAEMAWIHDKVAIVEGKAIAEQFQAHGWETLQSTEATAGQVLSLLKTGVRG